jgi:hypothetical protein
MKCQFNSLISIPFECGAYICAYTCIHGKRERAKCQFNSLISIPFVCGVYVYVYTHACMKKEQERKQNVSLIVSWKPFVFGRLHT